MHFQLSRIRFILVYRPPCYVVQSTADLKLSALTKIILSLSSTKDPIILLGDLNFPDIDWNLFRLNNSTHNNNCFIECMQPLGMVQFVSDSTRVSSSTSQNILDLVFSNDPLLIQVMNQLLPLSSSDHNIIEFLMLLPLELTRVHCSDSDSIPHDHFNSLPNSINLPKYNWSAADFESITEYLLNVDWHSLFGIHFDVESIWYHFKSIIWPIIDMFVPKVSTPHFNKYNPRHYPKNIRNLLSRKAAIWRTLRSNKSDELKKKYTEIVLTLKKTIIDFDIMNEEKIIKANNLGAFYRYINNKLNHGNDIAPLFDTNGNLITSEIEKANLLNDYFKSVFTIDNGLLPEFLTRFPPTHLKLLMILKYLQK